MGQEILSAAQKRFLKFIQTQPGFAKVFYLTGGTALAAYYLNHRYSEDLDFFSENEIDISAINILLKKAAPICGIQKVDFQQTFNRNIFFIKFANTKTVLKTEFTYYPFSQMDKPLTAGGLRVDSSLDIAVNKVFTMAQQPRARDFIDVYFIIKKTNFSFKDLLKKARLKFDWQIDPLGFGSQLLKAQDVKDYPRMLKKIDDKVWQAFFIDEAKKLGKDALK
jgi:predicted nucleotidyltransferase component of viral defense system